MLSGVTSVHLVGIRLGALFALDVARARSDVVSVIAWEPVIDGCAYHAELMESATPWRTGYCDVGGLVIAEANFEQIKLLSLPAAIQGVQCRVDLIASPHNPEFAQLGAWLASSALPCRSEIVEDALPWKADSEVGVAPIPAQATRVIKTWLTTSI